MLVRCPICGYSLNGLPERHRCPECGFDYDQRMEVIEQTGTLAIIFAGFLIMGAVGLYFIWPIRLGGLSTIVAPIVLVYMVWYVGRYVAGYRNKVVIGPEEIQLIKRRRVSRRFVWNQISRITGGRGSVEFRDIHDRILHSITESFLGSANRVRLLREIAAAFPHNAGLPTAPPVLPEKVLTDGSVKSMPQSPASAESRGSLA